LRRGKKYSNIESPCIKVCTLKDGVCIGCGRTQDEIRDWTIMTNEERRIITRRVTIK
tara:strand:+ start:166 stop:336 length:171 start_codon:yes stop_codon:yes gene_type:complete